MDIDTLKQIITGSVVENVFTFPNNVYGLDSLQSQTITNLFNAYLDDGTLIINDVDISQTSTRITVAGAGGSLPFVGTNINVSFSVNESQETTMVAVAIAQPGWTFATSYPVLENTILPELTFEDGHGFTFSSAASEDTPYGLAFQGNLQLNDALSTIAWLLGDGPTLTVNGPIEMHQTVPEMTLTADILGAVDIGYLTIPAVTFDITSTLVVTGEAEPPSATAVMHLNSSIQFHANNTNVTLPIGADFYNRPTFLQFRANLTDAVYATLTELSSLMNGADLLGLLEEEGVNLTDYLALDDLVIQVNPSTAAVMSVAMGVRTTQPWVLLTDPTFGTVFAIDQISLLFKVFDPLNTARLTLAVFGDLDLMNAATLQMSAVYPDFNLSGKLEENSGLNLVDIVQYFTGSRNLDVPAINLTYLWFFIQPSASDYEAAVTVESDWPISLGVTTLTIDMVSFSISYNGSGTTQARIGGALTIGPVEVAANWELPGDLQITATIAQISLQDLVAAVSSELLRADFPHITLENTQLLIAKYADGGFFLALGTTVDNFGTVEIDFKEVVSNGRSTTGYAFGFALPDHWSLSQLSSVFAPIDFLTFDSASLIVSSYNDPNFRFRALTGETINPPFSPPGVQAGMAFYAALSLNNSNAIIQTIARLLPGLPDEGLGISVVIPTNYSQTVLTAMLTAPLTILNVTTHLNHATQHTSITFEQFNISITPLQLAFDVHLDVTFVIFDEMLELSGDVAVEGEEVLLEVRTETPWINPFGIPGLILNQVAMEFELGAILAITLAGTVTIGSGQSAVVLHAAAEFNIDEEGIPDVFLAQEVGTISLAHIIGSFVGNQHVPQELLDINIRDFSFLIVANPLGWTDPSDQKHYSPGLAFSGEIEAYGLIADFALTVSYSSGIYAHGQLSGPLVIGPLTLANVSYPDQGPFLTLQSAQTPYVSMSLALTLFEIQTTLVATIESNAFTVGFSYYVGSVGTLHVTAVLAGDLYSGYQFTFDASAYLSIDSSLITDISAGRYNLGSLTNLHIYLNAYFTLDLGPGLYLGLSLGGTFMLAGINMTLPDTSVSIDASFTSFTQLLVKYGEALAEQLWDIGADLFQDADALFAFVADGFLRLTDDIGDILKHLLHVSINKAAQLLKSVADVMAYDINYVIAQLDDGWHAAETVVANALKSAAYAVEDIAAAISDFFHKGAEEVAEILREIGYSLSTIATVLKDVFGYTAEEVARFFKEVWHIADTLVNEALEAAGYLASEISSAMHTVFGWISSGWHTVTHYANPHNW